MRRLSLVLPLLLALALAGGAGASGPVISYTIQSGTQGDGGWWRSAVTVRVNVSTDAISTTCQIVYTLTTTGSIDCTATDGNGATVQFKLPVRIDTDPPTVSSATADRPPDGGGWYSHPVSVTFAGTDTGSGIAGCTSGSYSGPDSGSASVSGTCRDVAGNVSGAATFQLRYDTTPPTVTATPARPPDANGWYSHPVAVAFAGTDGGSGVSSCTPPATYSGPDSAQVKIDGGCVDAAGNKATAEATLQYDATPPKLSSVAVGVSSRTATLTWKEPPDATSIAVTRSPGRGGKRASLVYSGKATRFRDPNLAPGQTYRYTVAARDAAANTSTVDVKAAVPALYLPAAGARARAGTVLAWAPVKGASYYNVQLFHGATKVLSVWPRRPRLRLPRTWTFDGTRRRLTPGRYRWYVWPGHGPLKAAHYGRLLGGSTFVVAR
jgi:hypothetical protein